MIKRIICWWTGEHDWSDVRLEEDGLVVEYERCDRCTAIDNISEREA